MIKCRYTADFFCARSIFWQLSIGLIITCKRAQLAKFFNAPDPKTLHCAQKSLVHGIV